MYRLDVSDSGLSFAICDCQIFDAVVYSFKYFIPVAIAMGNLIMRVCGNHDFALNMQKLTVTVASTEKDCSLILLYCHVNNTLLYR